MGKSGYTSLSIEEKQYARLRKNWDQFIEPNTEDTFTVWAMRILEAAITRSETIDLMFPNFKFIGTTETGCIIQDKKQIVQVDRTKHTIVCSVHTELCDHCIYAALNSKF